jgi:hypothetical protein
MSDVIDFAAARSRKSRRPKAKRKGQIRKGNLRDLEAARHERTPEMIEYSARWGSLGHIQRLIQDEAPSAEIIEAMLASLKALGVSVQTG